MPQAPLPLSPDERQAFASTKRRWRRLTPWREPLLAPMKRRALVFLEPLPDVTDFRAALIAAPSRQQIVVIDDILLGGGPDRWACVDWLPEWAIAAGIIAGAARRSDYAAAAEAVASLDHLVMIETVHDRLNSWITAFAGRCRIIAREAGGGAFTLTEAEGRGAA